MLWTWVFWRDALGARHALLAYDLRRTGSFRLACMKRWLIPSQKEGALEVVQPPLCAFLIHLGVLFQDFRFLVVWPTW